jgi:cbb3-type cytochrome oxidase maturation protein
MNVILYLLGASLFLGGGGLAVFLWSLRSGQYDDLEGAANRILFDDDEQRAHAVIGLTAGATLMAGG